MTFDFNSYRVKPDTKIKLKDISPVSTVALKKADAAARLEVLKAELDTLQEELYAAGKNSVLVIMQGMDTSGKDGAIRHVFGDVNPQGCRVESFKTPTPEELAHDFLWRVHKVTPPRGMITVFNRSHYEDVLIVRVHDLVPEETWRARYEMINAFESLLAAQGTIILKFFLHISKDEQAERLLAREEDISKAWKLSPSDWRERLLWDGYQKAYEDALEQCSSEHAPWYIVPADKKWVRNLVIAELITSTLHQYRDDWRKTLEAMSETRVAELHAYRAQNATGTSQQKPRK
ncbi:MAG: polyphosphate kinase 2 family protein [Anaerolineae bacterium]|nr:polyphosphate kinase 2 family protein [Anaerolineae bacterium]